MLYLLRDLEREDEALLMWRRLRAINYETYCTHYEAQVKIVLARRPDEFECIIEPDGST